jgi:hypothetical protein
LAPWAQAEVAEKIRVLGANLLLVKLSATTMAVARREASTGHTLAEEDAGVIARTARTRSRRAA